MKILVTGGNGFLGKHLCERLRQSGEHEVIAPRSSECDLLNWAKTYQTFTLLSPDVVIHAAAEVGGIGRNRKEPARLIETNLRMGLHVVQACTAAHVGKLIIIGTTCSYPKHCPVPFKEADFWNGYPEETNAPYGIAKKTVTEIAKAYDKECGLVSQTLVLANLYGPGDNFNLFTGHVIPNVIRKLVVAVDEKQPSVTLWGDGTPTRDFLFVEDAADAIAVATISRPKSDMLNIGTRRETSIFEVVQVCKRLTGYTGGIVWNPTMPNGQPRRCLDVTRAGGELEWWAKVGIEEGLKRTVDWYQEHKKLPHNAFSEL